MTADLELQYTPPPTCNRFMQSDAPVRLIMGPVGSGKSTTCCMEIVRRAMAMPPCKDGFRRSRWAVVRNTRDQLKKTTLKTWSQWFPSGQYGYWKESDSTYYMEFDDVRAEVMFLPLDTPDDQRRLLSLELTGAFINEAREIHPSLIIALRTRFARYPSKAMCAEPYWYGLIMDTNPPNFDSFLHNKFEEEQPPGWVVFKQPGGLEPTAENRENLSPTYYEDLMSGATEDFIRVHVHGLYGRSLQGKGVYEKTFKYDFHVAKEPLRHVKSEAHPLLIGMDFGRTPAAIVGQRDHRSRVLVLDELYVENIGLENFLVKHLRPFLSQRYPGMRYVVCGDPAGWAKSQINEDSCADILKRHGFYAVRAPTNDVDKRIEAVEQLLMQQVEGAAMFLVSPTCKQLIKGFDGGYKYKRKNNGIDDTKPMKDQYSHPHDACQYMALAVGASGGRHQAGRRDIKPVSAAGWT